MKKIIITGITFALTVSIIAETMYAGKNFLLQGSIFLEHELQQDEPLTFEWRNEESFRFEIDGETSLEDFGINSGESTEVPFHLISSETGEEIEWNPEGRTDEEARTLFYFPTNELITVVKDDKVLTEINLKKEPSLGSEVVFTIKPDTKIKLIEEIDEYWYKVEVNGEKGFISPKYLEFLPEKKEMKVKPKPKVKKKTVIKKKPVVKKKPAVTKKKVVVSHNGPLGTRLVDTGKQFLGARYLYGAKTGRTDAFDCSSFTQYVYQLNGINIPRTARTQAAQGTKISRSDLKVGDLVFFNTNGRGISHVGIYIGNDKFIGAQNSGVGYADMNSRYWAPKYITARRIVQ